MGTNGTQSGPLGPKRFNPMVPGGRLPPAINMGLGFCDSQFSLNLNIITHHLSERVEQAPCTYFFAEGTRASLNTHRGYDKQCPWK